MKNLKFFINSLFLSTINFKFKADDQALKAIEVEAFGEEIEKCLRKDENGVYGYILYRNNSTLQDFMSWDRPVDAIEVPPRMKFCTSLRSKNQPIGNSRYNVFGISISLKTILLNSHYIIQYAVQYYYTCEECNRAWSKVTMGKNPALKLCEPCVFRCHKGHRGVRKVREAKVTCMCELLSQAIQCLCNARSIDESQLQVQQCGFEERKEWKRQDDRDVRNSYD